VRELNQQQLDARHKRPGRRSQQPGQR